MKKWFKLLYPLLIFPLLVFPTDVATDHHIANYQLSEPARENMEIAEREYKNLYYDGDREVFITTIVLSCITVALLVCNGLKINSMPKRIVFYLVTFSIAYALSGWFYNYNHFRSYWYDIFPELQEMRVRRPR